VSIELTLEIELGLSIDALLNVVAKSGGVRSSDASGPLAVFPGSGLRLFVFPEPEPRPVLTEDLVPKPEWRVGLTVVLAFVTANYDACGRDVVGLLRLLSHESDRRFVLSFQYERAYALRDERGLQFMEGTGLPL
jgi:hypothetical protein